MYIYNSLIKRAKMCVSFYKQQPLIYKNHDEIIHLTSHIYRDTLLFSCYKVDTVYYKIDNRLLCL